MNLRGQLSWALFISLICAIGFGVISVLVSDKLTAQFDNGIIAYIQGLESPWLTSTMKFFTIIGAGGPVAVIAIVVLFFFSIKFCITEKS